MSDKDMVTVYERRDGSKPGLWSVYWYLGWDVFYSFTVWQLNHLTWSITDYRVRISSNLEKGAHVEQSEK